MTKTSRTPTYGDPDWYPWHGSVPDDEERGMTTDGPLDVERVLEETTILKDTKSKLHNLVVALHKAIAGGNSGQIQHAAQKVRTRCQLLRKREEMARRQLVSVQTEKLNATYAG
jgi:hypothetical protein